MTSDADGVVEDEVASERLISLADVHAENAQDEIHLTDRGDGRRFALLYQHLVKYVADTGQWIVRDGEHWRVDGKKLDVFALTAGVTRQIRTEALLNPDPDARDAMLAYAAKTEGEQKRWRIINSALENKRELVIEEDDLDRDPNIIATPHGVVDLSTGEWRPTRSTDLCTAHTSVTYDPEATSPLLDQYLDTFVPDPVDQEVLFAILGAILFGGNDRRIFPIFIGGTTSGKSQLISALDNLFGDYVCSINASVFRGNQDDKPRPDIVRAMNKRIAYAVEASKIWELHADHIKKVTGGDKMPYRNLFADVTEKKPKFSLLIVTNAMPRIKAADPALKRRMITFRFDQTLPPEQEDASVKQRFITDERCLQALFARIVAGARSPLTRNGLRWTLIPRKYAVATLDAFNQLDHISEFLEWLTDREILVPVDMSTTPASHCARANELHEWYVTWVNKHGNKQDKQESLNMKEFGVALRERGWESKLSGGTRWLNVKLTTSPSLWSGW